MLAVMVLMLMSHRASSVNAQMRGGMQGGALRGGGAGGGRVLVLRNGGGAPVAREAFVKPLAASIKADVDAMDELAKKEAKAGSEALLLVLSDDAKTTVRVFSVREGVPAQVVAPELKIDSTRLRVTVTGKRTDENYWWRTGTVEGFPEILCGVQSWHKFNNLEDCIVFSANASTLRMSRDEPFGFPEGCRLDCR